MNYYHALNDGGAHVIAVNDPCTNRACAQDHYIVLPSSLWNDYGFLFDRLSVLGSRIETVEMPDCDE